MFCPLKSVASHCPKNTHIIVEKCRPQAGFGPKCGHRCHGCIQDLVGLSVGGREKGQSPGRMVPESHIPQPPLLPPRPVSLSPPRLLQRELNHFPAQRSCRAPQESLAAGLKGKQIRKQQVDLSVPEEPGRGGLLARQGQPSSTTPSQRLLPKLPPSRAQLDIRRRMVLSVFFNIHYLSLIAILYRWLYYYNNTHFTD